MKRTDHLLYPIEIFPSGPKSFVIKVKYEEWDLYALTFNGWAIITYQTKKRLPILPRGKEWYTHVDAWEELMREIFDANRLLITIQ